VFQPSGIVSKAVMAEPAATMPLVTDAARHIPY
jgi:hypothetical protein